MPSYSIGFTMLHVGTSIMFRLCPNSTSPYQAYQMLEATSISMLEAG